MWLPCSMPRHSRSRTPRQVSVSKWHFVARIHVSMKEAKFRMVTSGIAAVIIVVAQNPSKFFIYFILH